MSDRIFVKPGKGLLVRDEFTLEPIPGEGAEVLSTRFVHRRIACGDLVVAQPPAPKTKKSPTSDVEG